MIKDEKLSSNENDEKDKNGNLKYGKEDCACINSAVGYNLNSDPSNKIKGGFLFDTETGDVLFCGSDSCIDLKLPKSWRNKQKEKQTKQDQIIEMLSNIQLGTVNVTASETDNSSDTKVEKKIETKEVEEKSKTTKEEKPDVKPEKCDKEKKSLCKGSGGMQLGGTKMKLKKPKKTD